MNLNSSSGASASHAGFLATMVGVRQLCRERSAERAGELSHRFHDSLIQYRASAPGQERTAGMVSIALDRFVGEIRSAVEIAAAPAEASESDVDRVEMSVGTLNQMFVASEQAISVGTMQPSSFMPGAEAIVAHAMRDMRQAVDHATTRHQQIAQSIVQPKEGAYELDR